MRALKVVKGARRADRERIIAGKAPIHRSEQPGRRGPSPNSSGGKGRRMGARRAPSLQLFRQLATAGDTPSAAADAARTSADAAAADQRQESGDSCCNGRSYSVCAHGSGDARSLTARAGRSARDGDSSCGGSNSGSDSDNDAAEPPTRELEEWGGGDGPDDPEAQAAVATAREHWGEGWTLSRDNRRKKV